MVLVRRSRIVFLVVLTMSFFFIYTSFRLFDDDDRLDKETSRTDFGKLNRLLKRFERLLDYLKSRGEKLNLDGLFGVRIAQGVLDNTLRRLDLADASSRTLAIKLATYKQHIDVLASFATENVRLTYPDYYEDFRYLIDRPFFYLANEKKEKTFHIDDELLQSLVSQREQDDNDEPVQSELDEEFSDSCYALLLNDEDETRPMDKCSFTNECFKYFTYPKASGYYLTHQLLYFMIAEHVDCGTEINRELVKYLSDESSNSYLHDKLGKRFSHTNSRQDDSIRNQLFTYYCTKIFNETNSLYENFENPADFSRDLFIEQIMLCGILDFKENLNTKWMKLILSFQNKIGCFGSAFDYEDNDLEQVHRNNDIIELLNESNKAKRQRRFKRYDVIMDDSGCSSHESGLAFAYMSMMIDHLIESI